MSKRKRNEEMEFVKLPEWKASVRKDSKIECDICDGIFHNYKAMDNHRRSHFKVFCKAKNFGCTATAKRLDNLNRHEEKCPHIKTMLKNPNNLNVS